MDESRRWRCQTLPLLPAQRRLRTSSSCNLTSWGDDGEGERTEGEGEGEEE